VILNTEWLLDNLQPTVPWAASPAAWAQGEGGGSSPLLRSAETPLGVLCPALEPSAQGRPGAVGAGPEEAPAMIRGLEPLCWEERFRAACQYLQGACRNGGENRFSRACCDRTVSNGFKLGG